MMTTLEIFWQQISNEIIMNDKTKEVTERCRNFINR
jgi:hypothetical protein